MKRKQANLIGAALFVFGIGLVGAADEGWYVGAGLGKSKLVDSISCTNFGSLFDAGYSCTENRSDTAVQFFGGYRFNANLAVEAGHVDMGKFTGNLSGAIGGTASTIDDTIKAKGLKAAVVGTLPVGNGFSVLGRAGLFHWSVSDNINGTGAVTVTSAALNRAAAGGGPGGGGGGGGGGVTVCCNTSKDGNKVHFGVGVQYDVDEDIAVRAEFERYRDVGDQATTGQSDVDLLSVSVIYHFH